MKALFVIFLLLLSILSISGQKDSVSFFFNEFNVSLNRTIVSDDNTNDRFGFGTGIYHSMLNQKKINLIFGFEYNLSRQFKKEVEGGRWTSFEDARYTIQTFTIPFNVRFYIWKSVKFFIDAGGFAEINFHAKTKSTKYIISPNAYSKDLIIPINEEINVARLNYGFTAGLGIQIPVKKIALVIKTDYKHGFRNLLEETDYMYIRYIRLIIGLRI
ncbi:MAG: outer membrane beta-barrel protein [Bacteroidales bacterium]|jgi:hypothetical protein|nr:outer membrane beta-barrel protein [Bacteroidales bacterium]